MNPEQKEEFRAFFTNLLTKIKGDLEKETHTNRTQLDSLQNTFEKQTTTHGLKQENFDGNSIADASVLRQFSSHSKPE